MKRVKVSNMTNGAGRAIPNQFIIVTDEGEYFQSYDSVIGFQSREGKIYLDKNYWDYSPTTGKYRNQWLGVDKRETERLIKAGKIILTDLNK